MITLKEIAKEAGVSSMTVSNVINGNHGKVSAEKIKIVQDIIKKYNYVPNMSARSLAKRSSKMIAILVDTYYEQENVFKDPYLSELFGSIECFIRSSGYFAIIQSVSSIQNATNLLQNWKVDGAIFLSPQNQEDMQQLTKLTNCPMVFMDSYNNTDSSLLTVGVDDYKGGYIATKYLISNGHSKIGFAGCYSEQNSIVSHRYHGYLDALKEFNLPYYDSYLINTFTRYEDGLAIGRDLANKKYDLTAVFATADLLALGIIKGCSLNGYIVPNDLSVIGFDNIELCSLTTPALTTISQNVHRKADAAVKLLINTIEQKEVKETSVTCDVELMIRQTVQYLK